MQNLGTEFLKSAISRVESYKKLGDKTMDQLDDKDFSWQPNSASNSIATIIQHMAGNMKSRWTNFLTEDGEKPWRNRDTEFDDQGLSRKELMNLWEEGWRVFLDALRSCSSDDLLKTIYIRSEPLLVIDAINRQLAHYPHHVGQIIYIAKMIKGDSWNNLSIEKGKSQDYNEAMMKK